MATSNNIHNLFHQHQTNNSQLTQLLASCSRPRLNARLPPLSGSKKFHIPMRSNNTIINQLIIVSKSPTWVRLNVPAAAEVRRGRRRRCTTTELRLRLNVPPNTLQVISGTGFYGSNDPTNSVKALKEERSWILGFNPIRSIPLHSQYYNSYAVWNKNTQNTHR